MEQDNFSGIEEGIGAIRRGEMVIIFDDCRELEGDLVLAAEAVTPQKLNFMLKYAKGILCVPLTGNRLDTLGIPSISTRNGDQREPGFTIPVDAKEGITTGSSVYDRARTIEVLMDPQATSDDLVQPGHVFPLRAREGGLLSRVGHTEASIDLIRVASLTPAAVICEVLGEDGNMARKEELGRFAKEHNLVMITISALRSYLDKVL